MAKVRFVREFHFGDDRFIGVALGNELESKPAPQFSGPFAGSLSKVPSEKALQLPE